MRLIDADAALDKSCWLETHVPTRVAPLRTEIVYADELRNTPTIDAVHVVRCRECSRRYAKDFGQYCPARVGPVSPNGYCDEGLRREEGDA